MDTAPLLAFGACTLNLRLRELRLHGQPQAVAPKVFDLIVLLVERRQRVVSKDELLAVLWPGQSVSDGAIARAVMQARKAIGDADLIKTVHRVGYRFTGEPVQAVASSAGATAGGRLRLGLLPLANRTGLRHHDWTELGLAAMAIQALEADARVSMVGLPEMLAAMAPLPPDAAVAERVDAATQLLGLQGCVHAVLRNQGAGLWLDYQGHGERLSALSGSLRGDDPVDLGERLAREIRAGLSCGGVEDTRRVSEDPFVNQAYARAAQMQALHQFRPAAKLLAVVIEFEPANLQARLQHLLALANLEDPAVDALAAELAAIAAARGDQRIQARALCAAGGSLGLAERPGGLALAAQRLQAALALAEPYADEDWAVRIHLIYAWVALQRGELALARRLYAFVDSATAQDNLFQRALALDGRAALEGECGERLKAHGLLERSAQIYLQHRLHSTAALTLMNLALAAVELGLLSRALDHACRSESLFGAVQQPHVAASIAESAARIYTEARLPADIDRVLQRLSPLDGAGTASAKAQWQVARGLRARAAGDVVAARACLLQALEVAEANGSPVRRARRLQLWLELETAESAGAALEQARRRAKALLHQHEDADLRACLDRADAQQALRAGEPSLALAALQRAIERTPPGRVQALSRLDAAWLLADAGQAAAVAALLRPVGPWVDEHPLGRALARRLSVPDAAATPLRRLPSLS